MLIWIWLTLFISSYVWFCINRVSTNPLMPKRASSCVFQSISKKSHRRWLSLLLADNRLRENTMVLQYGRFIHRPNLLTLYRLDNAHVNLKDMIKSIGFLVSCTYKIPLHNLCQNIFLHLLFYMITKMVIKFIKVMEDVLFLPRVILKMYCRRCTKDWRWSSQACTASTKRSSTTISSPTPVWRRTSITPCITSEEFSAYSA